MPVAIPGAVVTISDMNGRSLSVFKANLLAGINPALDVSALAKGLYTVTIQWQTGKQVLKIMK